MGLTQHLVVLQGELLAGGQLPLTAVARKTRQMVDVLPGPAHPVAGLYVAGALGALDTKVLLVVDLADELVLLKKARLLGGQSVRAVLALQALLVPGSLVDAQVVLVEDLGSAAATLRHAVCRQLLVACLCLCEAIGFT